ncbi:MAG: hypothetical protein C4320_04965 [Armatimonadota bacterium]
MVRTPGNRARVSGPLRTGTPIIVGQAPSRGDFSRLPNRVYRSENIGIVGGYRVGYVHYDNRWRSDNFYYSYYGYSPFDGFACVSSPFYGYTFLPPYISYSRVFIESYSPGWSFTIGYPLTWSSYRYYDDGAYDQGYWNGRRDSDDRRFEEARYATRDLADAFEDGNARGVNRLLPRNGRIAILREGSYDYALSSDEFGRMLDDLIENSRTERYRIVESRGYGREVRVVARHDYTDPWGERRTMFHHILLSPEDGRYVIREFGTSSQRFW